MWPPQIVERAGGKPLRHWINIGENGAPWDQDISESIEQILFEAAELMINFPHDSVVSEDIFHNFPSSSSNLESLVV